MKSARAVETPPVGRDSERTQLLTVLDEATAGHGAAVLISGEPGIGKSALLHDVAASAQARGMTVLSARGARTEGHLPFAALHRLLTPLARGVGRARRAGVDQRGIPDAPGSAGRR